VKRFLYFGKDPGALAPLFEATAPGVQRDAAGRFTFEHAGETLCFWPESVPLAALDALRDAYFHLLVLDLRDPEGTSAAARSALDLLRLLDAGDDVEARYGFHRILALIGGPDGSAMDTCALELGHWGVGAVLRQLEGTSDRTFGTEVIDRSLGLVRGRDRGKTALCASGGGITGIYFELAALKCLDDCLGGRTSELDLYFGISAGAVVTSLVANGYSVDEIMAAIAQVPGGRIPPMSLRLLRFSHLHYADMGRRALIGAREIAGDLVDLARGRTEVSFDSLLLDYGDLVGAPFRSDRFERALRQLFEAPGSTNSFGELPHQLFVGASDQDARRHVLFGDGTLGDVPISRAVQASMSVHPAFSSVRIGGRFYEDGAVTRTSDFVEAIDRGARLVFIIDPFVPYVARTPGTTNRRGILYNIDQDLRTVSFTRFENTRHWVLRKHPEVSSYTFLPSNRLRQLLGTNPMDHRPYMEIWRGAYLSTLSRIHRLRHRMRGDLAAHGMTLSLDRAEAVADRLERTQTPSLADFFPDGIVDIHTPPRALASRGGAKPGEAAPAGAGLGAR
jgi:predicted acylesterase/phospholipase RssA